LLFRQRLAEEETLHNIATKPLQKLRLLLALGEKETTANQEAEAYASYQTLLREFPDYADKATVLRKLVPLARKLNKAAEAERLEAEIKKKLAAEGKLEELKQLESPLRVPTKYGRVETSGQSLVVKPGKQTHNINLPAVPDEVDDKKE